MLRYAKVHRPHERPHPSLPDIPLNRSLQASAPQLDLLWLLDQLWLFKVPLRTLMHPEMTLRLNVHPPPSGQDAIPQIAGSAWRAGLVCFEDLGPVQPKNEREIAIWFQEDREVVLRQLRMKAKRPRGGWPGACVALTERGGQFWERSFEVDWNGYTDLQYDDERWEITGSSKSKVEQSIQDQQRGPHPIEWTILEPWAPTYWKVLPCAAQASGSIAMLAPGFSDLSSWRIPPYPGEP